MLKRFLDDVRGNYMLITALAMLPIMGGLALAVDYSEMSRQRQATMNALDAAGIATAWYITDGGDEKDAVEYARDFFQANLGPVSPDKATLHVTLPTDNVGGGTLLMTADLNYEPYFYPAFKALLSGFAGDRTTEIGFSAKTEIRLKNTLEVALVLDNSGSMDYNGSGSGKKRIALLRDAAKELVEALAAQADLMKQVIKPVQFGLVPFAAAVNVGPQHANASWMDRDGISPIHHENFDWSTMNSGPRRVEKVGGVHYKKGPGWGPAENEKVTRFTLYEDLQRVTGHVREQVGTDRQNRCRGRGRNRECNWVEVPVYDDVPVFGAFTAWQGCVEMRPHPYALNDAAPTTATPETLFVPMFAPDETDYGNSMGDWWPDMTGNASHKYRQAYMPKYFQGGPYGTSFAGLDEGPNASCTTNPITPLKDVTKAEGLNTIKDAIEDMAPLGGTNVTEGIAWGWRVVSHGAPFTEGRPDTDKGNDKVVIVLTDGANTYYTPRSLGRDDLAVNKSIYANYGYARNRHGDSRILANVGSGVSSSWSNSNYTKAMNSHMSKVCTNAKNEEVIMITVALDLNSSNATEKEQTDGLRECASFSRHRKDADGKPVKLFWNTTGADLSKTFKEIADELSNLRIVG